MSNTKERAGILLNVGGEAVDLADISWYEKAPCGCVCGASIAYSTFGNGPARIIASAEQAAASFSDSKREREKYERLGFTWFPDLTSKCVELMSTRTECPHEPKFGVPERPAVEGYAWAAVHHAISRTHLMHLVPTSAVEAAQAKEYGTGRAKPLCGGKAAFWWSTEWYALSGKVECSRCWKKAEATR